MGTECPVVNLYCPILEKMSQDYAKRGVVCVGISANSKDDAAEKYRCCQAPTAS